jgi:two-component system cell cycle response regulator
MDKKFDELGLTGGLPSSLTVSMRIMDLMRGDRRDMDALVDTLHCDPALSLRLIKLANQTHSRRPSRVEDVASALKRIGWDAAEALLMGFSLVRDDATEGWGDFDHEAYWARAQLTACLCECLSGAAGWSNTQRAHSLGLLADVGTLALANIHRDRFSGILQDQPESIAPERARLETDVLGISHCEVSHAMLEDAGLTYCLREAVLVHKDYDRICDQENDVKTWAALLLASQAAAALYLGEGRSTDSSLTHAEELLAKATHLLGLSMEQTEEACTEAAQEWTRAREALGLQPQAVKYLKANQTASGEGEASGESPVAYPQRPGLGNKTSPALIAPILGNGRWGEAARILLVDDDPLTRRVVGSQLRRAGHEVLVARDGREGLEMALTLDPQIVITDWTMPGICGVELCELLRATDVGRRLCILMLTSCDDDDDQVISALRAGADDYVTKPSNPRVLQARVQAGLRTVHLRERSESMKQTHQGEVAELGILARQLENAALTDALTQLPNRRYAIKRLEQEWEMASRTGRPMSLIIADVDHFKRVNDRHGHGGGDAVLKIVSSRMREASRSTDVLCRFGGEEFLTLNPACNAQEALRCAERLRSAVGCKPIRHGAMDCSVTLSLGIAERTPEMKAPDELLLAADRALYTAKASGRNRCA